MGTLEENLRVAQPEIEPLQTKDKDLIPPPNGSVNASSCSINVYNDTTRPKPQFFRQVNMSQHTNHLIWCLFGSAQLHPAGSKLSFLC